MAARFASRYIARRFSSSGKVLSEEEKAAENVYIKKIEKERLEKLARKGSSKPGDHPTSQSIDSANVKPAESSPGASTTGVSTDQNRNYAVIAGAIVAVSALGWYFLSKPKKSDDVSN